ncbi:MAG: ligase-associated DNA damage response DEXH box helicase [Saprospiraceae bacterium]|nr:ligase-associated DNA damage response DEXH box helicase [Saprospiraceae bacterium]
MNTEHSKIMKLALDWFDRLGWSPLPYQEQAWEAYLSGYNGLVNAPTGSGKTYSLLLPAILDNYGKVRKGKGPVILWITPIRALAKEIGQAARRSVQGMNLDWSVGIRTGDTTTAERKKQWQSAPEILITTPESIHVMLATRGYADFFSSTATVIIDEWHELVGSKRGVQVQLGLSRLKSICGDLSIWGISATIGNLEESLDILIGNTSHAQKMKIIRSRLRKRIEVESIYPETVEKFPWSGHLGLKLLHEIIPIIRKSRSTLVFTNTRGQCEIWYQKILNAYPEFAGLMAMHHGSISRELRDWVEDALYEGRLKAVICTSSLDLGVDFRPVETIIQIGGPKGAARFVQRAGRSGHQPTALSKIYFVPTHAMEFIEAAALRSSIDHMIVESRMPYIRSYDVLIQYLMTLACSEGFEESQTYEEVISTHCYASLSRAEWRMVLDFMQYGGSSLKAYDEYRRIGLAEGKYRVVNQKMAQRHKMSIGTIVSDVMMTIKFTSGKRIGKVEEWFIAQFKPGDHFWFAGRSLEMVRIRDMTVYVKKSNKTSGSIPSWLGGRMSLSSEMSVLLRRQIHDFQRGKTMAPEMSFIAPLLDFQNERSYLPAAEELLIEYFETREGYHLVIYPFEGRFVHEAIGALIGYRLSKKLPISFSIAMNDYGVELLSDQSMDVDDVIDHDLFETRSLYEDIQNTVNVVEMSRRRFRDIARISGMIFEGFPGQKKKERHLQNSAQLLFDVFREYEPDNLLYQQAIDETMTFQFEEARLRRALERIRGQRLIIKKPDKATPFAFPIMVDRLREHVTSEKLEDRVRKMTLEFE